MNMRLLIGIITFFIVSSVGALPDHPYASWRIICLSDSVKNQTVTHPDGTMREVAPSETWSAELQNNERLLTSSVRCWCKDSEQYEWDTECLGSGNGWWTMVKLLNTKGESCICPAGQAIMVEMDHNLCQQLEGASGFFHCSGCPESAAGDTSIAVPSSSVHGWVVAAGVGMICAYMGH
jgi:hypothetical protein